MEAAVVAVEAVEAAEEDGEDEAMVDIEAVTPPPPELFTMKTLLNYYHNKTEKKTQ